MKRYVLKIKRPPPGISLGHWIPDSVFMEESDDGEWVRFEDVEKEKFSGIAKAIIIIANDLEKKRLKAPVCNCEYTARSIKDSSVIKYWICPTHGYKKI